MTYQSIHLKQPLTIDEIISIHYFEFASNFSFPGESHDFWEFFCVDSGETDIIINEKRLTLHKGDIIFFAPNEFHNIITNGLSAPNIAIVSFQCDSDCMQVFKNKKLTLTSTEQSLLAQIIVEARKAFSSKLDDPYLEQLTRTTGSSDFGAEQLIKCCLEHFLILLYRDLSPTCSTVPQPGIVKKRSNDEIYSQVLSYLKSHINETLTTKKICEDNLIGRSQLQKMFHKHHQCGVIDYFCHMKIKTAKQLIRDNQMNISQISDCLGYSSVHYFCRQFKQLTRMTPTEYATSIKSLSERPEKPH